jgi:maltoporin
MSPLEKEIYLLREAIEDRRNFLSSQRFSTKNIGVLDVAYKQTPIYQQSLLNLEKMLVEGTKNSVNKGNNKDSLLDKLL